MTASSRLKKPSVSAEGARSDRRRQHDCQADAVLRLGKLRRCSCRRTATEATTARRTRTSAVRSSRRTLLVARSEVLDLADDAVDHLGLVAVERERRDEGLLFGLGLLASNVAEKLVGLAIEAGASRGSRARGRGEVSASATRLRPPTGSALGRTCSLKSPSAQMVTLMAVMGGGEAEGRGGGRRRRSQGWASFGLGLRLAGARPPALVRLFLD